VGTLRGRVHTTEVGYPEGRPTREVAKSEGSRWGPRTRAQRELPYKAAPTLLVGDAATWCPIQPIPMRVRGDAPGSRVGGVYVQNEAHYRRDDCGGSASSPEGECGPVAPTTQTHTARGQTPPRAQSAEATEIDR
jgi:hypothetical protein